MRKGCKAAESGFEHVSANTETSSCHLQWPPSLQAAGSSPPISSAIHTYPWHLAVALNPVSVPSSPTWHPILCQVQKSHHGNVSHMGLPFYLIASPQRYFCIKSQHGDIIKQHTQTHTHMQISEISLRFPSSCGLEWNASVQKYKRNWANRIKGLGWNFRTSHLPRLPCRLSSRPCPQNYSVPYCTPSSSSSLRSPCSPDSLLLI